MQIETSKNVPTVELKSYLRTAAISSKTTLAFFYIGNDQHSITFLEESFRSGYSAADFDTAKKLLDSANTITPDVFIIDTAYNQTQLEGFYYFLKNRNLDTIPLIYNDRHLRKANTAFANDIIDDVIDLN